MEVIEDWASIRDGIRGLLHSRPRVYIHFGILPESMDTQYYRFRCAEKIIILDFGRLGVASLEFKV